MRRKRGLVHVFALMALMGGEAQALRCGGDLVSLGDLKIEVLAKCGEPVDRVERHVETTERVLRDGRGHALFEERRRFSVEEWVYDFGPSRFLVFLWFRDGRLVHEETGGYGYTDAGPSEPGPTCWSESMATGRRRYEVLRYCGEPASRDWREVERARREFDRRRGEVREIRVTVTVEEWVYNFGPNRLLYVFTFENGRVVKVETRGYGF